MKPIIAFLLAITIAGGIAYHKLKGSLYTSETIIEPSFQKRHYHCYSKRIPKPDPLDTEILMLQHKATILRAIIDYQLDQLYQQNIFKLQQQISRHLKVEKIPHTHQLKITFHSDTKEKADQINYALTQSYNTRKIEQIENTRRVAIEKLRHLFTEQESKVETNRKKLYKISKKIGLPYHGLTTPPYSEYKSHKPVLTIKQHTTFNKAKDNYEREFSILQSISDMDLQETILEGLEINPLRYHHTGWTKETAAMMDARKN